MSDPMTLLTLFLFPHLLTPLLLIGFVIEVQLFIIVQKDQFSFWSFFKIKFGLFFKDLQKFSIHLMVDSVITLVLSQNFFFPLA